MSHTVQIKSVIRDFETACRAARRLNWDQPFIGESRLYDGTVTNGIQFRPARWLFPVCADLQTGELQYDNYIPNRYGNEEFARPGLRWPADIPAGSSARYAGNYDLKGFDEISPFIDAYNAENAIAAAQREGWHVEEMQTATGEIELTLSR